MTTASTTPTNPDWIWQGGAATQEDGEKDGTAYGSGSSEATAPSTWTQASSDTPKADIRKYYLNVDSSGDIVVSFGFTRQSNNGDTAFAAEFNQKANLSNNPPRPDRTPGDLLLKFHMDTSANTLFFAHAFMWEPTSAFGGYSNCTEMYSSGFGWCEISRAGFEGRTADDNFTAEGKVDLTTLFDQNQTCSGFFNAVNLRGESSAENWTNSLQDYVGTPGASVPSTCSNLVIRKYEAGTSTLLTGAQFDVYAGSTASGTPLYDNIADGDAADTDSVAGQITLAGLEPGTYTVVEVVPPTGYFLPAEPSQTLTVGKSSTITYDFYDVLQWQPLNVSKSANGTYDATYDWDITKSVGATIDGDWLNSLTKDVADDGTGSGSAPFGYQVVVTQGARHTSHIEVSGNLFVDNPNDRAVEVTLADHLADGTACTFADSTVSVPANAVNQAYPYTCTYPDGTAPAALATENDAQISWDKSTYPQTAADALATGDYTDTVAHAVPWTATETNKTVTITDDHYTWDPAWTITWTGQGTTETRTYTRTLTSGAGNCHTETNTAAVVSDGKTLASDDATAEVCVGKDLAVSKVSQESLTRTYAWDITKKSTDTGNLFVDPATGKVTAHFQVDVTAGDYTDKAWMMSGAITVTNPNRWEDVVATGVTDVYSGGSAGDCSIDGWASMTTADKTIPRSTATAVGSKTFHYTCVFTSKPAYDGTNTATVTWDKATASTPDGTAHFDLAIAESDWTLDSEIDKTVTVWDDNAGTTADPTELGQLTWAPGLTHTYDYTVDLTAPAGECKTWTNTATVNGDGGAELDSDSADAVVCNAKKLDVTKTADGSFTRTYDWGIEKQVRASASDPWSSAAQWQGDAWSHVFDYRVVLSQLGWSDSGFQVTGAITVANPNTAASIPAIASTLTEAPDLGAPATCVVADGPDAGTSLVGYSTGPIASGDHVTVDYRCDVTGVPPAYSGTDVRNVVTATNTATGSADAAVTFVKTGTVHESASISDDHYALPTTDYTYDESHPDATYSQEYSQEQTATATGCDGNTFENTATVASVDLPLLLQQSTATATVCPNPGTWTVAKSSDSDGPVAAGSHITYTLTAHKTGGVDPTDVVVTDDLGALAPYVTLPASFSPSTGTASLSGSVLTWTIPDLSDTETLHFTVTVNPDAFGVDLPNLVVSPGSQNCPDQATAQQVAACNTDSDTPAYTLAKSSDAGATVMPPYLGAAGTTITYTLTVHNTSDAPINATTLPGAAVTDDLSDVLDNATFVAGSISGDGSATRSGDTLTWVLPTIPAGGEASISYQVTVNDGAWNATLANTATPGTGGHCVADGACQTTTATPPVTHLQVKKVNAETGAPLAGAGFTLYADEAPFADAANPQIGPEDQKLGTATSGDDGLATFGADLLEGHFLLQESAAPQGYALPVDGDTMAVVVDDGNFVPGGTMAPFEFRDPANGQLAIVAKQQYEKNKTTGAWELSDGVVNYGDEVRYVVKARATGNKLFHNVTLTDYVPGYNPDDHVSTAKATLIPGSAKCTGSLQCTVTVSDTGLITWSAGTVTDAEGTVEFVVRFPTATAAQIHAAPNHTLRTDIWNVAQLAWDEVTFTPTQQLPTGRDDLPMAHHVLNSNEVIERAVATEVLPPVEPPLNPPKHQSPPPAAPPLPNTGGPAAWVPLTGIGLLMLGAWLMLEGRLRRRKA